MGANPEYTVENKESTLKGLEPEYYYEQESRKSKSRVSTPRESKESKSGVQDTPVQLEVWWEALSYRSRKPNIAKALFFGLRDAEEQAKNTQWKETLWETFDGTNECVPTSILLSSVRNCVHFAQLC